jgi:hypothetical protein
VWKFQDLSEKKNILKIKKTTAIRPKNGKLSAIILVIFKYFSFSQSLEISTANSAVFQ